MYQNKTTVRVSGGEDGDFRVFGNTPAWDNACVNPAELLLIMRTRDIWILVTVSEWYVCFGNRAVNDYY